MEVFEDGQWRAASRAGWDEGSMEEANVVCRQLGYTEGAESQQEFRIDIFSSQEYAKWHHSFDCLGDEATLFDCDVSEKNSGNHGVGVVCKGRRPELIQCLLFIGKHNRF